MAATFAAVLCVLISGRVLGDRRSLTGYGLRVDRRWLIDIIAGLCIGLVGVAIPFTVGLAAGWFEVVAILDPGDLALLPGIALIVIAMLFVGFWEELIFRGVFIRNTADGLRRWLSPHRAIAGGVALSTVVFTVGHVGQPEHPAFIGTWLLAGLLFAIAYVTTGNLALPIGIHASFSIGIQTVFVRTDIAGIEGFSALTRIHVDPELPRLFEFGGTVEAAAFITIGLLTAAWLLPSRRRSGLRQIGAPPETPSRQEESRSDSTPNRPVGPTAAVDASGADEASLLDVASD